MPQRLKPTQHLRTIIRRESGEGYREMLTRMAQESGIETPTAGDLVRLDRARKGKKLSNKEWASKTDPDAKIAKLKDGRTRLAYKPEHAVDLDTGVIVAAALHPADQPRGPGGRRGAAFLRGDPMFKPGSLAAVDASRMLNHLGGAVALIAMIAAMAEPAIG